MTTNSRDKQILENIALELDELQIQYDKLVIEHSNREVDLLQFLGSAKYMEFCKFCKNTQSERNKIIAENKQG